MLGTEAIILCALILQSSVDSKKTFGHLLCDKFSSGNMPRIFGQLQQKLQELHCKSHLVNNFMHFLNAAFLLSSFKSTLIR